MTPRVCVSIWIERDSHRNGCLHLCIPMSYMLLVWRRKIFGQCWVHCLVCRRRSSPLSALSLLHKFHWLRSGVAETLHIALYISMEYMWASRYICFFMLLYAFVYILYTMLWICCYICAIISINKHKRALRRDIKRKRERCVYNIVYFPLLCTRLAVLTLYFRYIIG